MSNDVFREVVKYIPERMLELDDRKNLALTCNDLHLEPNVSGEIKKNARANIGLMASDVLGFSTSAHLICSNIYSDVTKPYHAINKYDALDRKIASLPHKLTLLRTVLRTKLILELEGVERHAASERFMNLIEQARDKSYAPRNERRTILSDVLKSAKPLHSQNISYLHVHRKLQKPELFQEVAEQQMHIHEVFPVMPFRGVDDSSKSLIRHHARYGLRKI